MRYLAKRVDGVCGYYEKCNYCKLNPERQYSFAQGANGVESNNTSTKRKRERVIEMVGVEVFARGEDTLACRLQASLTRLHGVCELHSATQSGVESNNALTKKKKRRTTARAVLLFLVEVWRFELQASSTRNWRATNCATPRLVYAVKAIERFDTLDFLSLLFLAIILYQNIVTLSRGYVVL